MGFDSELTIPSWRPDAIANTLISSVLVATEGKPSHDAAVRVAAALAARAKSVLRVVSVIPPQVSHSAVTTDMGLVQPIRRDSGHRSARLAAVREQMQRVGVGERIVTVISGWPGIQIVAAARRYGATLIVMGIGRHLPLDRFFGTETALDVVRWTTVPVLAVADDALPERAIAAVDFERSSIDATRVAAALLAPGGAMQLIHVTTPSERAAGVSAALPTTGAPNDRRLDALAQEIGASFEGTIETLQLRGDPAGEILAHADASATGLIAVGRPGDAGRDHPFCGTLAERLLRGAHCSVLVAPVVTDRSVLRRSPVQSATATPSALVPVG